MSKNVGIQMRHSRECPKAKDREAVCRCKPAYRAEVYDRRSKTKLRKTFPTISAAKAWRHDASTSVRRGTMRASSPTTLLEAAEAWLAGARDGSIRTRGGDEYKPSVIRGYEATLRLYLLDDLGAVKLSNIGRRDVQDLADRLLARGLDPSTCRNALMPLRAIYRRAVARGEVALNPTSGIELPAVRGKRDRIASPEEAAALIEALPERDQALWATAMYAGLRRGELLALRFEDIDLAGGVIHVERSWDLRVGGGAVEPKSRAGRRTVPIPSVLRGHLAAHKLRSGRAEGLAFGQTATTPQWDTAIRRRAVRAWKAAGLDPIGLHEARHTCASIFIAAGVNAKALSTYLGHSSIQITLDRYGHLMPGNEDEPAVLVDAYLEGRLAQAEA